MKHTHKLHNLSSFILPFLVLIFAGAVADTSSSSLESEYITRQCKSTLYPEVCNQCLSQYAESINRNPRILASIAIGFTLNSTRDALSVLRNLQRNPQEDRSLVECVEVVGEALYNLQRSMRRIERFEISPGFESQMDDIETWVSAALTDDSTCIDDFPKIAAPVMRATVRNLVINIARMTSIALTFINQYAAD